MADEARSGDGDGQEPLDAEIAARNTRLLKRTVYIMGVLLVAGTIVLIAAIIWKASQLPQSGRGFAPLDVAVPTGATVRSVEVVGDRMTVAVEAGEASEIIIIDLRRGEVHGRVRLSPEAPVAADAAE